LEKAIKLISEFKKNGYLCTLKRKKGAKIGKIHQIVVSAAPSCNVVRAVGRNGIARNDAAGTPNLYL
jgi:hypothetical protein